MAKAAEYEEWDEYPDDEDPTVEAAEADADDALAILRKQQKHAKHVDKEEREALGSIITEFLKEASPEQIELADVFLDGVTTSTQARKAIDKITARAAKLNPEGHIVDPLEDGAGDEPKHGDAFAPPLEGQAKQPLSKDEELNRKIKAGKVGIDDLMETWETVPTGQWSYKE